MKKVLGLFFAFVFLGTLVGCKEPTPETKEAMTYAEFMAAEAGDDVIIEGFIVAKQGWWDNKVTMYLAGAAQGEGYFVYELACTEEENNNVYTIGTCIRIEAAKTIYAEEHEIMGKDITKVEVVEVANFPSITPIDVTEKLDNLIAHQNAYFTATLTVKEFVATDANTGVAENGAYGYKGDAPTDDLYFTLTDGTNDLNCCVEYYLTGSNSDVYKAVQNLSIGDKVIVEGYLYWWNGANPHITSLVPSVMTYTEFMNANSGDNVIVEGFVSAKQSWWNGQVTMYLVGANEGEGYFLYNAACTEEENNTVFALGNYVRVYGVKMEYAGEEEISPVEKFEVVEAPGTMPGAVDLTNKLANLIDYQNAYFTVTLTVKQYTTTDQNTKVAENGAYGYKGDAPTDDLYFTLTDGTNDLSCCIEYYLTNSSTATYQNVLNFQVGDKVKVTGYLYWWNGANPHIISVEKQA